MEKTNSRVLGRVLAVEEIRSVHGAQRATETLVEFGQTDTGPLSDASNPRFDQTTVHDDSGTCDDSYPQTDTICNPNSDVIVTDPLIDCSTSSSTRDLCLEP